jgi:histidyl-tRNA synthetase
MPEFTSLPGFREFYPAERAVQNHIFATWRKTAESFGFQEWDAPVLEPLELFTEKSGEEIVRQLFNFEDKGGRQVSLRPEMTPSLARLVAARAGSLRRPVKWFAIGENYRYEKQQKGRLRAFYQFNADILGEAGPAADAEIIALAVESLRAFGLNETDFRVRLSDRTLWFLFLESIGVPEAIAPAVLGVVDKLERLSADDLAAATATALAGTALDPAATLAKVREFTALDSIEKLEAYFGVKNAAAADGTADADADAAAGATGETPLPQARTPDSGLRTPPDDAAVNSAAASPASVKIAARLADWRTLLAALDALGLGNFITTDTTIVRGLAYYTGFVFEIFERNGGRALAGGGRYDALVKKLGGPDMPAAGFGMGDVTLKNLLDARALLPAAPAAVDYHAIVLAPECRPAALAATAALRRAGLRADYSLKEGRFGKLIQAAEQTGARTVLVFGPDELRDGIIKVRNTATREETTVPADGDLAAALLALEKKVKKDVA